MTLTDAQLAELEALREAATPGPWRHIETDTCGIYAGETLVADTWVTADEYDATGTKVPLANGALIVAAVNALPALLREVRALRALEPVHAARAAAFECPVCDEVEGPMERSGPCPPECPLYGKAGEPPK